MPATTSRPRSIAQVVDERGCRASSARGRTSRRSPASAARGLPPTERHVAGKHGPAVDRDRGEVGLLGSSAAAARRCAGRRRTTRALVYVVAPPADHQRVTVQGEIARVGAGGSGTRAEAPVGRSELVGGAAGDVEPVAARLDRVRPADRALGLPRQQRAGGGVEGADAPHVAVEDHVEAADEHAPSRMLDRVHLAADARRRERRQRPGAGVDDGEPVALAARDAQEAPADPQSPVRRARACTRPWTSVRKRGSTDPSARRWTTAERRFPATRPKCPPT